MSKIPYESRVEDTIPKLDDTIAVGEDLAFQRKWWRFERIVWPILFLVVVIDMLGGFGRGWLSKAHRASPDGSYTLDYERIERASTPSIMTLQLGRGTIHDGRITVYISDSVVKALGALRVSPQPAMSRIGSGGITYVFPAGGIPASVQIELQPSFPGLHGFRIQVEGGAPIDGIVAVMP